MPISSDDELLPDRTLALVNRADRGRLSVSGPDRARFLHNLTTQDVKALAPGQGAEAFITTPQGKSLAYVGLLALDDRILVRTEPADLPAVLAHLSRYGVFDDIALDDQTPTTFEWHILGRSLDHLAIALFPDSSSSPPLRVLPLAEGAVAFRENLAGWPGLTVIGPSDLAEPLRDLLRAASPGHNLESAGPDLFDLWRIAAGTPVSGRDVTTDTLPQEARRDRQAISFTKGCYLGQETVARLDALGHVNKDLRRLDLDTVVAPAAAQPLLSPEGKPAGTLTSTAFSPARGRWIGLALVRVAFHQPATRLLYHAEGQTGEALVLDDDPA